MSPSGTGNSCRSECVWWGTPFVPLVLVEIVVLFGKQRIWNDHSKAQPTFGFLLAIPSVFTSTVLKKGHQ